jgi:tRNA (mo5U34)-methyltransferase
MNRRACEYWHLAIGLFVRRTAGCLAACSQRTTRDDMPPECSMRSGSLALDPKRPESAALEADLLRRFSSFLNRLRRTPVGPWANVLERLTSDRLQLARHGDLPDWVDVLDALPALPADRVILDGPCVSVDAQVPVDRRDRLCLQSSLERLHPWRKGPFCMHGVHIDAEWRSDLKWARIADAVSPLAGRRVLDVGCGNGYYGYRALGAGADLVVGIDPTVRFVLQFLALNRLLQVDRLAVLPLADDDLPMLVGAAGACFDTLFSMGVLYHRRDPLRHLERLRHCLRPGGELVLETLVIDGAGEGVLEPERRYAKMRNVHAIPTVATLNGWLEASGFVGPRLADLSRTTPAEQRSTAWMRFHSLADFLDPVNPALTVEGYPAPQRALLIATRGAGG